MIDQPICYNCKRKRPATAKIAFSCDAFPNGIPDPIVFNQADHRDEYRGDHGLRFDPIDPEIPMPTFGGDTDEGVFV